jgi:two-component sensor histidine kinase
VNSKAHDLFLLLLSLAQVHSEPLIVSTFCEGLESHWENLRFSLGDAPEQDADQSVSVATAHGSFGHLCVRGPWQALPEDERALIRNAARMLGLFLEKRGQERQLADRGVQLEEEVARRTEALTAEVTRRIQAERRIRASLAEKEVLLQEIHHRVKNNLQIVAGLLYLQAEQCEGEGVRRVLLENQQRIHSLALVHDEIYRSENMADIRLDHYLQNLAPDLLRACRGRDSIRLDLDTARLTLPLDTAIPCGLLLNELLTNAVRHAFAGREGGRVRVVLERDDHHALLAVEDDGVGLPPHVDPAEGGTLGMRLITALAGQLGARVEVDRSGGTAFRFRFPLPAAQNAPQGAEA